MKLPKAKSENIVVQNLPDEILVYDLTTNQAFCLNETLAKIFNHCDGETSFAELKEKYQLTDDIIYFALDKLEEQDLLAGEYVSPFAGINRREVIKKVGLATMIALPMISSLVAPTSAQAASGNAGPTACAQRGGTCIPAQQNICTGVVGQTFDLYYYSPNAAGACRGADSGLVTQNFTCTNNPNNTSFFDVCRVPR